MNINKVIIYGNLTRDPDMRQLPSGVNVTNISVATNRVYTNQNTNEKVSEVEYHNVVLFSRLAEIVNQYLRKGSGAFIEGRLRTSSWEADGVKKYKTEIVAEGVQFGPRRGDAGGYDDSSAPNTQSTENPDTMSKSEAVPAPTINPDDIPF